MGRLRGLRSLSLLLPLGALLASCQSATALRVTVNSEIPCSSGAAVVLVGGSSSALGSKALAVSGGCDGGGLMGSVVVLPAASHDESVAFALMQRSDGKPADTCLDPAKTSGCIVAKRQFRFQSQHETEMRVDLRLSCLGVLCSPDQTCVKGACVDSQTACGTSCDEGTLASVDGGVDGSGGVDAGTATLIFDEEFTGGSIDTNKWVVAGDGTWLLQNGKGEETKADAFETLIYAKSFTSATDYHIVARMRSTGPFGQGRELAPEICFRTDPSATVYAIPQTYHCNFGLRDNQLLIQRTEPLPDGGTTGSQVLSIVSAGIPSGFDLSTPFVLDAVVKGNSVTCSLSIDGLGVASTTTYTSLNRLTGSFGLKTYDTTAEFSYFRVYTAP